MQVSADAETGQTIISGMGELHLEIYVERMRREYKVPALLLQSQHSSCVVAAAKSASAFQLHVMPAAAGRWSVRMRAQLQQAQQQLRRLPEMQVLNCMV